jgi:hypothetical protein
MTDLEARLAAALHSWYEYHGDGCTHFDKGYGPYARCEDFEASTVETLLVALPTLAADLALAAAVRRLPGGLSLHHPRDVGAGADYFVRDAWGHQWYADTPEAAIKAAKEAAKEALSDD